MTTTVPRSWTSIPWSRIVAIVSAAQDRVVDVGRGEVGHDRAVVERVGAAARPVDELVAHDEVARLDVRLERAGRARRDDGLHAERAHRPDIGPVVDPVRRDRVAPTVARQEGDPAAGDVGQEERVRRRAVGRIDLDLAHVLEQRVEARAAEHADLRSCRVVGHASPPVDLRRRTVVPTIPGILAVAARSSRGSRRGAGVPTAGRRTAPRRRNPSLLAIFGSFQPSGTIVAVVRARRQAPQRSSASSLVVDLSVVPIKRNHREDHDRWRRPADKWRCRPRRHASDVMPKRNGPGIELLADPTRRRIIAVLAIRPRRPSVVAAEIGLSRAATSRQLHLIAGRRPHRGPSPVSRPSHADVRDRPEGARARSSPGSPAPRSGVRPRLGRRSIGPSVPWHRIEATARSHRADRPRSSSAGSASGRPGTMTTHGDPLRDPARRRGRDWRRTARRAASDSRRSFRLVGTTRRSTTREVTPRGGFGARAAKAGAEATRQGACDCDDGRPTMEGHGHRATARRRIGRGWRTGGGGWPRCTPTSG